ncbi:beta-glucoside-specific PTS transporter subunit IIABC [Liquorilactobacillus hordei]|uniref:beta-glucoside-specific PTS transporter subunit IIABC n=1 Tax=Liquorilactobacillus hordei TaxID=468911 RepID=UPI001CBB5E5C|nr:beta-glucoside-specific PTS transporter subunit IIABC [Liquorilactobacillus hordei]MBZ2406335.1 PTS beta-glucoside transporter subunit EIIBCA [Liquorilactobacillus hordei]
MIDYKSSAKDIIRLVGTKENIIKVIHCSTRLRFTLSDFDKVDLNELKEVTGVMGAIIAAGQCQVIVGNNVVEMFDAVQGELGSLGDSPKTSQKQKMKPGAVFLDFLIGVFQPLIPAIAGGGMLKSILLLFSSFGWMSATSSTYSILNLIGSAPLIFLPLLVGFTTAQKLNVNPVVAMSAVAALLLPDMTTALTKGATFLGMGITNITYASQVFPAILCVLLYSILERILTKYSPKAIRIFFVPLVALTITVPITLLFLGPAGYIFGEGFTKIIFFFYSYFGFVATALLAGLLPLLVSLGMHKAFIPYAVAQVSTTAGEPLYLPASIGHNFAESGVCFAVAIRTKDKTIRATAISAAISAFFGITEPALYGITLQNKRALGSVMAAGAIGGGLVGFFGVKAFVAVGPGIASMTMFTSKTDNSNLLWAFVGMAVTMIISFVIGLITWKDRSETIEVAEEKIKMHKIGAVKLTAPVIGKIEPVSQVGDSVFSSGILGEGIAIIPQEGKLFAPIDGKVTMVYETKHALGMTTDDGIEILFHIGIDTVKMNGKGFELHVEQGQNVKQGELLIEFDIDQISNDGYDPTVMMIVTDNKQQDVEFPAIIA